MTVKCVSVWVQLVRLYEQPLEYVWSFKLELPIIVQYLYGLSAEPPMEYMC